MTLKCIPPIYVYCFHFTPHCNNGGSLTSLIWFLYFCWDLLIASDFFESTYVFEVSNEGCFVCLSMDIFTSPPAGSKLKNVIRSKMVHLKVFVCTGVLG